jgi:hypothetical protein
MITGIYSAKFWSGDNRMGIGIVVIDGGAMHGGDLHYIYRGKYRFVDNTVSSTVEVENYSGTLDSALGPLNSFRLALTGTVMGQNFDLSGSVENRPNLTIRIELKKIGNLVDH